MVANHPALMDPNNSVALRIRRVALPAGRIQAATGRGGYAITNGMVESLRLAAEIDAMRINNLLDGVDIQRQGRRNPEAWAQMVSFLREYPFVPMADKVYGLLQAGMPGNTPAKRKTSLMAWVKGNVADADRPILDYYAAYHAYSARNYDEALKDIGEYKTSYAVHGDRIGLLEALCRVNQNQMAQAKEVLDEMTKKYGQSPVMPEALYLQGWISIQMQRREEGLECLKILVANYPQSESAIRAGDLLRTFVPKP